MKNYKILKIVCVCILTVFLNAFPSQIIPAQVISCSSVINMRQMENMEKNELLNFLLDNGLVLPDDYEQHRELAENFVQEYTPLLMNGAINPYVDVFNYSESNELIHNLSEVLCKLNLIKKQPQIMSRSSSSLNYSTPIGTWRATYRNYNCYAYAIGKTTWATPGDFCGQPFSLTLSVSSMADIVISDLDSLGFNAYKTTTKPTTLPDRFYKVICIRKNLSDKDFHFMKQEGMSLTSWTHKPGCSQPLRWNFSSPGAGIWTNEGIVDELIVEATTTYESNIYYIVYKSRNSAGTQFSAE